MIYCRTAAAVKGKHSKNEKKLETESNKAEEAENSVKHNFLSAFNSANLQTRMSPRCICVNSFNFVPTYN